MCNNVFKGPTKINFTVQNLDGFHFYKSYKIFKPFPFLMNLGNNIFHPLVHPMIGGISVKKILIIYV